MFKLVSFFCWGVDEVEGGQHGCFASKLWSCGFPPPDVQLWGLESRLNMEKWKHIEAAVSSRV